jgi:hypothetical protein
LKHISSKLCDSKYLSIENDLKASTSNLSLASAKEKCSQHFFISRCNSERNKKYKTEPRSNSCEHKKIGTLSSSWKSNGLRIKQEINALSSDFS